MVLLLPSTSLKHSRYQNLAIKGTNRYFFWSYPYWPKIGFTYKADKQLPVYETTFGPCTTKEKAPKPQSQQSITASKLSPTGEVETQYQYYKDIFEINGYELSCSISENRESVTLAMTHMQGGSKYDKKKTVNIVHGEGVMKYWLADIGM